MIIDCIILYNQTIISMTNRPKDEEMLQNIDKLKNDIRQNILTQKFDLPIHNFTKQFTFEGFRYINTLKKQIILDLHTIPQLTRFLQILEIVIELIHSQQFITKRNLYYKLVHYYQMYSLIDSDLEILTFHFQTSREQMHIFSSSKCQIAGNITLQLDHQTITSQQHAITSVPNFKTFHKYSTTCKNLVIIQKESALFQLNQELRREGHSEEFQLWMSQSLFISAKGYPDSTVRSIIEQIWPSMENIYYLGDQDVYGLDILLNYSIGYHSHSTLLHTIKWIQFQTLLNSTDMQHQYQALTKEDKIKIIQLLNHPYFKQLDIYIPSDEWSKKCASKLLSWKARLLNMKEQNRKIELQSIFKCTSDNWLEKMVSTKSYL